MTFLLLLGLALQDPADLIGQLADDDPDVRDRATEELFKLGEKALPHLVKALDSRDPEVRARADALLYRLSGTLPLTALSKYPKLAALKIRGEVESLIKQMDKQGLTSLGHFQSPRDNLKHFAKYKRLVEIGKPAVPLLVVAALDSKKKAEVRYFIAIILAKIGDDRAVPALVALLSDKADFTYSAG